MGKLFDRLMEDVRMKEGLTACMNCGICTGLCPAAEFYNYDPRRIVNTVQSKDDAAIEELLRGEEIWYCGECMSCRPRCPRSNTPGYVIQSLRRLSQEMGLFTQSEKGRQQLALKRVIGENILNTGYCLMPKLVDPDLHLEQGPVWRWIYDNDQDVFDRFGENYCQVGVGAMRKIDSESLDEVRRIFALTGGEALFDQIESCSATKATQMGYNGADQAYFEHIYTTNNGTHANK